MSEQFKEEIFDFEIIAIQKYKDFVAALKAQADVTEKIDSIFKSETNRGEAEKMVLKEYGSLMDSAVQEVSKTLAAWLEASEKSVENEKRKDDMRDNLGKE